MALPCRGKKAKRKAREKQLEEARRLASLQKKRELKAAGIEMRDMKRKTRGINYNNEVAFEKKPTAGFYDVGEERQVTKEMGQEFRPVTLEEMEGKRRKVGSPPHPQPPTKSGCTFLGHVRHLWACSGGRVHPNPDPKPYMVSARRERPNTVSARPGDASGGAKTLICAPSHVQTVQPCTCDGLSSPPPVGDLT